MPTYDYECQACDHRFELFQQISAEPLVKCPECGKKKLRRLFGTGAAVVFKGSGFYQTDYRSDSYKKASAADQKASSGDSAGSSGKTEKATSSGSGETSSSSAASKSSESKSGGEGGSKRSKKS